MQSQINIINVTPEHFADIIALGNNVHGDNYLNEESLTQIYKKGLVKGTNLSFVALTDNKLVGFRLTYAPGNWQFDEWCSPDHWRVEPERVCYFKCNTVDEAYRGYGIGGKLLSASIEQAKQIGSLGGVAHLWRQSPGNSAVRYFTKSGGVLVKDHPDRWNQKHYGDSYVCPICQNDCHCVAAEMIILF